MGSESTESQSGSTIPPQHTPGHFSCPKCGWSGEVNGRRRCLPCYAAATRRWRRENPAKAKEHKKAWVLRKGPEYAAQRKRTRRANNPETTAAAWARRVEWLKTGDVTKADLAEVYADAAGRCHYCGTHVEPRLSPTDPRGFDHIVPRAKGGLHTKANIVVCCGMCNSVKSDKVLS